MYVCVCNSIIVYVVHYRPPPLQQLPMDFWFKKGRPSCELLTQSEHII